MRCEARQLANAARDFVIDPDGAREPVASVDDSVTDSVDVGDAAQPVVDTVCLGRPIPRVEVERGFDLVIGRNEPQLEGA